MRLGGDRITPVNVRVVSATNRNLKRAAEQGAFRQDLLHRLDTLVLAIPPLRARREDIIPLAERFIAEDRAALRLEPLRLDAGAKEALLAYSWPGNVRELRNFCERLCVIAREERVTAGVALGVLDQYRDWGGDARNEGARSEGAGDGVLAQAERSRILSVLEETNFSRAQAAKRLGVNKSTLWRKMRKHRLL